MRKKSYKTIRSILLILSILFVLIAIIALIYVFVKEHGSYSWIISASTAIFSFIMSNILSFVGLFVLPKDFSAVPPTKQFSDRRLATEEVLDYIADNKNIIKIAGQPLSGKSEFLKYLCVVFSKKNFFISSKKVAIKRWHRIYYIDGDLFIGKTDLLLEAIEAITSNKFRQTFIIIDNIYKIDNPNIILDKLFSQEKDNLFVIYTTPDSIDPKAIHLSSFEKNDIKELSEKYNIVMSEEEITNLYLMTQGNVGLITLILKNYQENSYIKSLDINENSSMFAQARKIVKGIVKNSESEDLCVLIATINYCEKCIDSKKLSRIFGFNVQNIDLINLKNYGLLTQRGNTFLMSDYIAQLIRSTNYIKVQEYINTLIRYYDNIKNEEAKCILVLGKSSITDIEAKQTKDFLVECLKTNLNKNDFILMLGQVFKENMILNFENSQYHKELEKEIIYQLAKTLIYIGDYKRAEEVLIESSDEERTLYLKADLEHLQNDYDTSIGLFTILDTKYHNEMAKIKIAHCIKHKGDFEQALSMLTNIQHEDGISEETKIRARVDSLSLYILLDDIIALEKQIHDLCNMQITKDYQQATIKRYNAVLLSYKNDYEGAMREIEAAIKICEDRNSRLKYNCFFIRGEINRHHNNYDKCFEDFWQCYKASLWNYDCNLRSISIVGLELIKEKVKHTGTKWLDASQSLEECANNNMTYNVNLLSSIVRHKVTNSKFDKSIEAKYYIVP